MDQATLPKGVQQRILRGGPMLRIVNDPSIEYQSALYAAGSQTITGVYVLVGFDADPTAVNHQGIVPPFSEATIYVPETVTEVRLLWPNDIGAQLTAIPTPPAIPVQFEWLPCVGPTGIRPLFGGPLITAANQRLLIPADQAGAQWPPAPPEYIYDQALGTGSGSQHMRPRVAPSVSATNRFNTAVNTLFNFTDSFYGYPIAGQPGVMKVFTVKRILVSASLATLLVWGANNLTVGAPGANELGRVNLVAGVTLPIEYDEGLEMNAIGGTAGAWRAYTSVAVVLDVTFIMG